MPPKKAKRKAKAKAKVSRKRARIDEALPDFGEDAEGVDEAADEAAGEGAAEGSGVGAEAREPAAADDEDETPLADLLPKAREEQAVPKDSALPSFDEVVEAQGQGPQGPQGKEDEDEQLLITGASLGTAGQGDEKERDVWQELEKELEAPLEAVSQVAKDPGDDDEWGISWKGQEVPEATDVLDQIAQQAASAKWHQQEWAKKEERHDDHDDAAEESWGLHMYQTDKDKKAEAEDWRPDAEWECTWPINSKEAMAVANVVRKIRSRAGDSKDPSIEPFPNDTMVQVITAWTKRTLREQQVLLAAVLFLEASTLEIDVIPPDLSSFGLTMMTKEDHLDALRGACAMVPQHVLLRKAAAIIPNARMRQEAPKVIDNLKKNMSSLLVDHHFRIEEDELSSTIDEAFLDQPTSLLIMGLVHCCEYLCMMKRLWDSKGDLYASLMKQVSLERCVEVFCRADLQYSMALAGQCLSRDALYEQVRKAKTACLNRLGSEWRFVPSEENLMLLHMLPLERQLHVLLGIERDVELKWCDLMGKVDSREERSEKLREFLNFQERLRPYLNEEDLMPGQRPLEMESGQRLQTNELALVRQGVSEVFKKLKQRYKWRPDINSRKAISKANWVARLSATVRLAKTTYTLSADKELRKFLQQDCSKNLGIDVYKTFQQWAKLEQGDGMQMRKKKVASEAVMEKIKSKCEEILQTLKPKANVRPQFQPSTPAALGAAMTPGLAAMTPGLGTAAMTPGLNPATPGLFSATPGLSGAVTPGYRAPTPNYPGFTPAYKESEGHTPQWRQAVTPRGMPTTPLPGTPGTPGRAASRTPVGLPPPTPGAPPLTPAGAPPFTPTGCGAAQPMTPERVKDVKDVKSEG